MSPVALRLLQMAYKHYQETGERSFSYQYKKGNDMFYGIEAANQLYDDGYIDDVSDFVFEDSYSPFDGPISFTITDKGLRYIRVNGEMEN